MATARANHIRQRAATRGITAAAASFRATRPDRSRVRVWGGGGDYHADRRTRRILRELSQDMERNAECYDIFLAGVAGLLGAPTPRPTTPDEEWNQTVSRRWKAVSSKQRGGLDARGLQSWDDLCTGWWRAALRDGDIATIPLVDGTISTILADQIDSPPRPGNQYRRTIAGFTLGPKDEILTVWIAPRDAHGQAQPTRAEPFAADQVSLMAWRYDNTYSRGVPILAAGLDNTERIDALVEAEVISAEQASNLYGAITRERAAGQATLAAPLTSIGASGEDTGSPAPSETQPIDYVSFPAGSYLDLPPGTRWDSIAQTRPNLNVPEFLRALLSISCARVGIPYAVIFCDFKGVNWSGNRGLVSLTRDALSRHRQGLCEPFIDPLYPWWLANEIANGTLRPPRGMDPEAIYAHAWDWPDRPEWPDPYKEERRHELALSQYTDSLHRIVGPDWHQRITERQAELIAIDTAHIQRIAAAQQQITAANLADHMTWRDVIALTADRAPVRIDMPAPASATATDEDQ